VYEIGNKSEERPEVRMEKAGQRDSTKGDRLRKYEQNQGQKRSGEIASKDQASAKSGGGKGAASS